MASWPFSASPQISKSASRVNSSQRALQMAALSSTIGTVRKSTPPCIGLGRMVTVRCWIVGRKLRAETALVREAASHRGMRCSCRSRSGPFYSM